MNSNWSYSPETPNLGQIRQFLELCDLGIWCMTLKNNRAPLLCYFKLCASFCSHGEFKLVLQFGNAQFGSNSTIFRAVWPSIWRMTFKNHGAPFLCYFKLCASFRSHWWIQTGVTVRTGPIWVKLDNFLELCDLEFLGWPWKTTEHLFYAISSFVHHGSQWWIKTGVTVRKRPIWVKFDDF